MIPKIAKGIVIISNLLMVVVLEISAKKSQNDLEAVGDSKKVNNAQDNQEALPNIVTYESKRG